ncbi:NmrA family transcriptional regulator [Streptomyces sp. NPDC048332]|uniref:NmrA family transcriptional regulator n=1 Tax=Streptomyces sp. NPDC048332 TaxID=3154619 RepID=UPI0034327833
MLVLGGTGRTGRRVVQRLAALHLPVRIGSRSSGLPFDWQQPTTWQRVLADVRAAYIAYQPDIAAPGAAEEVGRFARLAVASGVRRLVLLSRRGEPEAERAEEALRQSGAECAVVRSARFHQNFSDGPLRDAVLAGRIVLPADHFPEPFVDADDVADIAAAALTRDGHIGQLYEVTGPELLTLADVAARLSEATGRRIDHESLTAQRDTPALARAPEDITGLPASPPTAALDDRNAHLTDGVRRVLGRPPRGFADYARRAAAAEIWNERRHA